MSDFSLTAGWAKRDPAVFAPRPDVDYATVAHMAWLDTQLTALDVDAAVTETHTLSERLQAALLWFKEHGKTNPQYAAATRLQSTLDARYDTLLLSLRVVSIACWMHCCTCYAALQHVADRAGWLRDVAGNRFDGESPYGIWRAVLPNRKPAGTWPLDAEGWIERRVLSTEVWNIAEAQAVLAQKGTA